MEKSKAILGFKKPGDFTPTERKFIVDEYLRSSLTKRAIWKKHTGMEHEHGYILRWMRNLGYDMPPRWRKLETSNFDNMLNNEVPKILTEKDFKAEITELKKELAERELQVEGLQAFYLKLLNKPIKLILEKSIIPNDL